MPVESAPAVAGWLCTQPHVACLALQASPERGGSKEQRVTYERAGLASAQSTSGAHTVRTRVYLCSLREECLGYGLVVPFLAYGRPLVSHNEDLKTATSESGLRHTISHSSGC